MYASNKVESLVWVGKLLHSTASRPGALTTYRVIVIEPLLFHFSILNVASTIQPTKIHKRNLETERERERKSNICRKLWWWRWLLYLKKSVVVVVSSHKVIIASIKSDFIDHHYENWENTKTSNRRDKYTVCQSPLEEHTEVIADLMPPLARVWLHLPKFQFKC